MLSMGSHFTNASTLLFWCCASHRIALPKHQKPSFALVGEHLVSHISSPAARAEPLLGLRAGRKTNAPISEDFDAERSARAKGGANNPGALGRTTRAEMKRSKYATFPL